MAASYASTEWIWRDGEFVPWASATIHIMSHVVHYGSSVFEGIRCYHTPEGPAIFRLDDHIRRLRDSARILRMDPGYTADARAAASAWSPATVSTSATFARS
jgi:branched-chain amino acid aminotransferase